MARKDVSEEIVNLKAEVEALKAELEATKSKSCEECPKLLAQVEELKAKLADAVAAGGRLPGEDFVVLADKKFRVLSTHDPKGLYDAYMKKFVPEDSTVVVLDKKPV